MEEGLHLNDKQADLETVGRSLAPAPPCHPPSCHSKLSTYYANVGFWHSSVYLRGMLDNYESGEVTAPC